MNKKSLFCLIINFKVNNNDIYFRVIIDYDSFIIYFLRWLDKAFADTAIFFCRNIFLSTMI